MAKKQGKKEASKVEKPESNNRSSSFGTIIFLLLATLAGLASFYMYKVVNTVPELPKFDESYWWGPLPVPQKQDVSVRPFKIEFSDVMINDLKERLLHRRPFTPPLEDIGFQYGFNTNFLTKVLDFWQNKYDFKQREQFFNKFSHYKTNIQGLDIHFMHVKPANVPDGVEVVPLLMLHGWPGSVREFYEIVPQLTTPRAGQQFVFEVVAPSLPGYGFSQAAVRPGLGAPQVSVIFHNLMRRLRIAAYYVQGGDWGHIVAASLATLYPAEVLGFHTNMPVVLNPKSQIITAVGAIFPSLVVEPELAGRMYPWSAVLAHTVEETGYMHLQATKPDTVGAALTDSPAGLAAYILEKFSTWTDPAGRRAGDGELMRKFSLTSLLDNVMLYWATNSITTSMRLYAETFNKKMLDYRMDEIPTAVPTWGIKMKHELVYQPDCALRTKYTNYLRSTVVDDGGHFAALELPELVANDIYLAVKSFREFHRETRQQRQADTATTMYDFTATDLSGRDVPLSRYRGHVALVVNVASRCGLTDRNYAQLNQLHDKYSATRGLRILAFPCNQFNGQEPGSSEDIFNFTRDRGVKFDLFQKVDVNGDGAHPLWKFLKRAQPGAVVDMIKWNFSKFIVDKNGVPVERLGPNVDPVDLEPYLAKYW